jgi:hypothetical protein
MPWTEQDQRRLETLPMDSSLLYEVKGWVLEERAAHQPKREGALMRLIRDFKTAAEADHFAASILNNPINILGERWRAVSVDTKQIVRAEPTEKKGWWVVEAKHYRVRVLLKKDEDPT